MTATDIIQVVQQVGIVAVVLGACMYFIYYIYGENRKDLQTQREMYQDLLSKEQERHSDEMASIRTALEGNTIALEKIYTLLDKESDTDVR